MKPRAWILGASAAAVVVLAQRDAQADASSAQKADALFREGRALMDHGHYAEAREKLQQSETIEPGIGTLFNMADCDEHLGLIATAWNEFNEVATQSHASGQAARASTAEARAATLLPRLPRLVIDGLAPPGADVKKDGATVSVAELGKPLPVDPGAHVVRIVRGAQVLLEKSVTVAEGTIARVNLTEGAENKPDSVPAAPVFAPSTTAQPAVVTSTTAVAPAQGSHTSTQKIFGGVIGGAGIAAIGVGTYFGIESLEKRNDSRAHCVGSVCDATGVDQRSTALSAGNASTVFFIAGAVAAVGGGILFFTAPSSHDESAQVTPRSKLASMSAAPFVGPTGSGLVLSGAFQ